MLTDVEPQWLVLAASVTLIAAGIMALAFGFWSFRDTLRELDRHGVRGISLALVGAFTLMLIAAAGAGLVLILID